MALLRMIVLKGLVENVRVFARHVKGTKNDLADSVCQEIKSNNLENCATKRKNLLITPPLSCLRHCGPWKKYGNKV